MPGSSKGMADDTTQRAAFAFLREHLQSQEPFTLDEFIKTTGCDKTRHPEHLPS